MATVATDECFFPSDVDNGMTEFISDDEELSDKPSTCVKPKAKQKLKPGSVGWKKEQHEKRSSTDDGGGHGTKRLCKSPPSATTETAPPATQTAATGPGGDENVEAGAFCGGEPCTGDVIWCMV